MASFRDVYKSSTPAVPGPYTPVATPFQAAPRPVSYFDGTVDEVLDADTVSLRDAAGQRRRVRLANIDAQETGHGVNDRGQPLGAAQRDALAQRVAGKSLRVGVMSTDKYGRAVGTLYDGDTDVNKELVSSGNATRLQSAPADYWQAQQQAQQQGKAAYQRPDYQNAGAFRHLVKGVLADPLAEQGRFDTVGDGALTRGVKQSVHGTLAGSKALLADAADALGMDGSSLRDSAKESMRYASGMARESDDSYNLLTGGTAIGRDVGSAAGSVAQVGGAALASALLLKFPGLRGLVTPQNATQIAKAVGASTSLLMNAGETSANAAADDGVMGSTTARERLGTSLSAGAIDSAIELAGGLEGKALQAVAGGGKHLLNTAARQAGEGFFTAAGRRAATGMAKAVPGEAIEEGAQNIIGQVAMNYLRDTPLDQIDWVQVGKDALSGAVGGGVLGGVHNPLAKAPVPPAQAPAAEPGETPAELVARIRTEQARRAGVALDNGTLRALPAPGQLDSTPAPVEVNSAGVAMTPTEVDALAAQADREAQRAAYEERMKGMYQQFTQRQAEVEQMVQAGELTPEQGQSVVAGMQEQLEASAVWASEPEESPHAPQVKSSEQQALERAWDEQARWEQEQRDLQKMQHESARGEQGGTPPASLEALLEQEGYDPAGAQMLRDAATQLGSTRFNDVLDAMHLPPQRREAIRAAATYSLPEDGAAEVAAPQGEDGAARAEAEQRDGEEPQDTADAEAVSERDDVVDEERPLHYDDEQFNRVRASNKFRDRGFTLRGANGRPVTFSAHSIVMEEGKDKNSWRPGESDEQRVARLFFEGLGKLLTGPQLAREQPVTYSGTRYTKKFENGTLRKGNAAMVQKLVPSSAPTVDTRTGELIDEMALDFPDNMVIRAAKKDSGEKTILWKDIKALGSRDTLPGVLASAVEKEQITEKAAKAFAARVKAAANAVYEATHESFGDETSAVRKEVGPALLDDARRAIERLQALNTFGVEAAQKYLDQQVRNADAWLADLEESIELAMNNDASDYGYKQLDQRSDAEEAKLDRKVRTVDEVTGAPLQPATQKQLLAEAGGAEQRENQRKAEESALPGTTTRALADARQTLEQRQAEAAKDEAPESHAGEGTFRQAMQRVASELAAQFAPGGVVQVVFSDTVRQLGTYSPYSQTVRLQSYKAWQRVHADGKYADYLQVVRQTLAHEVGHHVQWWTFDRERSEVKQAVYDAWLSDLRTLLGNPTADNFARLFGHPLHDNKQAVAAKTAQHERDGSSAVIDADTQKRLSDLSRAMLAKVEQFEQDAAAGDITDKVRVAAILMRENERRAGGHDTDAVYRLGFSEWFANNFARYAESRLAAQSGLKRQQELAARDAPLVQGFWRKMYKTMREFFGVVKGRRLSPANATFTQWLNRNTADDVVHSLPPRHLIGHEPLVDDSHDAVMARSAVASHALQRTPSEARYLAGRGAAQDTAPEPRALPEKVLAPEYRVLEARAKEQEARGERPQRVVLTGKSARYLAKDQAKSDRASKFIGTGAEGTSTHAYTLAWQAARPDDTNSRTYDRSDTVFVSVNGGTRGAMSMRGAKAFVDEAIAAQATIIADAPADRAREYNTGERLLAEYLAENGYAEVVPGTWAPSGQKAGKTQDDAQSSWHGVDRTFEATPEQQQEALDYLAKILPDSIDRKFLDLRGMAGRASVQKQLIRLSTHALNPTSTAAHEAMHLFFAALKEASPDTAKALVRWAGHTNTVAALHQKLQGSPEALAQLDDPLERVAYAFQFYIADKHFALPVAAQGYFAKLYAAMRHVLAKLGLHSDDDRARLAMDMLHSGAWRTNAPAGFAMLEALGREGYLADAKTFVQPFIDAGKKLMVSQPERLRATGVPALAELADLLYYEHGATGAKYREGYVQEVHRRHGEYAHRVGTLLDTLSPQQIEEQLADELRGVPSGDAKVAEVAGKLHGVLRGLLQEMKAAGCDIGDLGPRYFPRVYNTDAMQERRAEFVGLLQQHKVANPDSVYQAIVEGGDVENISGGANAATPGMSLSRKMELPLALTPVLQEAGFLDNDAVSILNRYVHAAVKRTAYAKRFGDDANGLNALLDRAAAEGASSEERVLAVKAVSGVQGTLGANISPQMRKSQAAVVLYENLRVLTTGILSQLPDVVGLAIKSGNPADALKAVGRAVKEAGGYWREGVLGHERKPTDYWEEVARAVGVIENHYLANASQMLSGTSWTDGTLGEGGKKWKNLRWLNDKFFAANFMSGWNNSNRAIATQLAAERIAEWAQAKQGDPRYNEAVRNLADLGLEQKDVLVGADGLPRLTQLEIEAAGGNKAQAEKMSVALHRWVDGAVLRPNAGHRPGWMNDPHYMIFAHLKQFMWTQQKTVLRQVVTEAKLGNYRPMIAGLSMYLAAGLFTVYLRALVKGGGELPEWMRNKSVADMLMMGVDRSGVLGVRGLVMDVERDWSRGEILSGSLIGPAAKHVTDAVRDVREGEIDNLVVGAMPTQDAWGSAVLPHTDRVLGGR